MGGPAIEPSLGDLLGQALASERQPSNSLHDAALGDPEVMLALSLAQEQRARSAPGLLQLIHIAEALIFARLHASAVPTDDALARVVALFGESAALCRTFGDMEAGDEREAMGLALLSACADESEAMADFLQLATPRVSAGAIVKAKHIAREHAGGL